MLGSFKRTTIGSYWRKLFFERTAESFLLSFPKSGRTWLRLMIAKVFQDHYKLEHPNIEKKLLRIHRLHRINRDVPRLFVDHDGWPHWKKPEELDRKKAAYAGRPVVLLVRDPRDVIVSFYFEQSKRTTPEEAARLREKHYELRHLQDRVQQYTGDISAFIREDVGSFKTLIEYMNIWAERRKSMDKFLLVRYEDMKKDTFHELRRTLDFIGESHIPDKVLKDAVAACEFDKMRKMEQTNTLGSRKLRPTDPNDLSTFKTRKGKVGGFADSLTPEDIEFVNSVMTERLDPFFGYMINEDSEDDNNDE